MRIWVPSTVSGDGGQAFAAAAGDSRSRSSPPGRPPVLLRPRSGVIEPAPVDAGSSTSPRLSSTGPRISAARSGCSASAGWRSASPRSALIALRPPRRVFDRLAAPAAPGRRRGGAGISLCSLAVEPAARRRGARSARATWGSSTQDWGRWAADVVKSAGASAPFAGDRRRAGAGPGAPLPAPLVDPGRGARGRRRRRHHLALPGGDRSPLQQVRQLPHGELRSRGARSGATGPHVDVGEVYRVDASRRTTAAERLRERARAQQAGGALRQPDQRPPARPGAPGGGARARATSATTTCCAASPGWRSWRPRARCWPSAWPSASGAARAGDPGTARRAALPAIALAVALVSFGARRGLERAVAPGRGERRRLLARPDARPRRPHPARAPPRDHEPRRPRSAASSSSCCSAPTRPRCERIGIGEAWAREH